MKLSIATKDETLKDLITVIEFSNADGVEGMLKGLTSYDDDDILKWLIDYCFVYVAYTDDDLKAIFILQWVQSAECFNLHVCTLDNTHNWHEFFETIVKPEIAKYKEPVVAFINKGDESKVRLFRRYGYEPEWKEDIKAYQYLISL